MEYGLSFLPDIAENDYSAVEYFQNALMLSKFADEAGFKTIKMTEHYTLLWWILPKPINVFSKCGCNNNKYTINDRVYSPRFPSPVANRCKYVHA